MFKSIIKLFFNSLVLLIGMTSVANAQNSVQIDSLNRILPEAKSDEERIEILNELSWQYSSVNFEEAFSKGKEAVELSQKISSDRLLSNSYNRVALAYDYKGNLDSALKYYNISYTLRLNDNDMEGVANILNNIGACYHYQSVFDSSLVYYMKALEIRERIKDEKGLSESYNNVGIILRTQKEYEKSKGYYLKSLHIKKQLKNKKGMMFTYSNLSVVSGFLGENEEALEYSKDALDIAYELQDSSEIGGDLTNIGVVYNKLNLPQKAIENLKKGNVILKIIGDRQTLSQNWNSLGDVYYSIENYEEAVNSYEESMNLALVLNRRELQLANSNSLSEIYALLGNYQKAWENLSTYTELNEEVFNQGKSSLIADLETKYQTEKKQKEILELSEENELNNLRIERDSLFKKIYIAIVVIALFVIGYILFLYRSKRKLSAILEEKNILVEKSLSEKETLLKEIHHRVKNNLQVISSLLSLQSRYIDDDTASKAIEDSKNRVKSMALIHQKLYQEDNLKGVNVNTYIHELTDSLSAAHKYDNLRLQIEAEEIELDVDTIIPIGLIINELVTNALKYGVKGSAPEIIISFKKEGDNLVLKVKDNGEGLPDNIDISKLKSYGMKLVHSLSRKLKADVSFKNDKGLEVLVLIKKFKLAE